MENERLTTILNVLNKSKKALTLAEIIDLTGYSKGCIYWFLKNDVYGIKKCGYKPIVYYTNIDVVSPDELEKKKPKIKRFRRKSFVSKKVVKLHKIIHCIVRGRNISTEQCIPNKNHNDCNECKMMLINIKLAVA